MISFLSYSLIFTWVGFLFQMRLGFEAFTGSWRNNSNCFLFGLIDTCLSKEFWFCRSVYFFSSDFKISSFSHFSSGFVSQFLNYCLANNYSEDFLVFWGNCNCGFYIFSSTCFFSFIFLIFLILSN